MNNANQELNVVMFHGSYHFVQELYFILCILYMPRSRDDVHIVSTEAAQRGIGI